MNMVDLNNKRIIVTGGLGFIGFNFIQYLHEYYKQLYIVCIDKQGVGSNDTTWFKEHYIEIANNKYKDSINSNTVEIVNMDLAKDSWNLDVGFNYDYIFHFAAESHVDRSINGPIGFIHNNIMAISNLLETFRVFNPSIRIVNISTDEVYGHLEKNSHPFRIGDPLKPRSPYSASKASADLIANSYVETYGMNIVTTRCCNNFGPYQCDEKFIPTIVRNMVQGTPVPIYGDGKNIREWIYVEDHNKQILKVANFPKTYSNMYHIGSGHELSNLELVQEISKILKNYEPTFKFIEDRKGHDFRYALKVDEVIDIGNFRDNLMATVRFYEAKYKNE